MARPLRLRPHRLLIKAPRGLVYQLMTSFGNGRLKGDGAESSRVLWRDGDSLVAEFKTTSGRRTYTTVERVSLWPPERITFQHIKGPLSYACEEFVLTEVEGGTELVHRGEFVWKRMPVLGRLVGVLYVRPAFERLLEKHMQQLKEACEARAARSHVFRSTTR